MVNKAAFLVAISCLVILSESGGALRSTTADPAGLPDNEGCALEIYLPREVTVKDGSLELGEIGVIRGDESLAARARAIGLGRICVPGQKVIVDRAVVLSRLASNGIPADAVKLTGAEKVTVTKEQQIVTGQDFVEVARSFLKTNPPVSAICALEAVRVPRDLVLSGPGQDVKMTPSLVRGEAKDQAKIRVGVAADGKEIGAREVSFRLKYGCRRVVSAVEISAGEVISPENVRIETAVCDYPEPANWKPPYGSVAKRRLAANTVVLTEMVEPVKSKVVVNRNETVVMRIESPGLLVTAVGVAMQEARAGGYVKVRNVDSQRIILCKVSEDGTVEPVR